MARKYHAPAFDKKDRMISKINHLLFDVGRKVYHEEYESSMGQVLGEAIDEYAKKLIPAQEDLRETLCASNRPTEFKRLLEFLKEIKGSHGISVYGEIEAVFNRMTNEKIARGEFNFVKKIFKKGFGYKGSYHSWTTKELSGVLSAIKSKKDATLRRMSHA